MIMVCWLRKLFKKYYFIIENFNIINSLLLLSTSLPIDIKFKHVTGYQDIESIPENWIKQLNLNVLDDTITKHKVQ